MNLLQRKARQASERDHRYQNVMRSLVRRYVTNEQRTAERQRGVTEDDCNEIKQDISALRYELIRMLEGEKQSVSGSAIGRKGRQRERRLMKGIDFNFLFMDQSTASFEDDVYDYDEMDSGHTPIVSKNKTSRSRFVRLARGLAGKRSRGNNKWKQLLEATRSKVMPFSRSSESVNSEPCGENTKSTSVSSNLYRLPRAGVLPSGN